jgi:hypothetical protein
MKIIVKGQDFLVDLRVFLPLLQKNVLGVSLRNAKLFKTKE